MGDGGLEYLEDGGWSTWEGGPGGGGGGGGGGYSMGGGGETGEFGGVSIP